MTKEEYIEQYSEENREELEEALYDYSPDIDYPVEDLNSTVDYYINSLI
jgi:hypothetical protein